MKNYIGIITGFVIGLVGFLLLFKVFVLERVPPEDELAPGIVVFVAVICGIALAFVGYMVQKKRVKNR